VESSGRNISINQNCIIHSILLLLIFSLISGRVEFRVEDEAITQSEFPLSASCIIRCVTELTNETNGK